MVRRVCPFEFSFGKRDSIDVKGKGKESSSCRRCGENRAEKGIVFLCSLSSQSIGLGVYAVGHAVVGHGGSHAVGGVPVLEGWLPLGRLGVHEEPVRTTANEEEPVDLWGHENCRSEVVLHGDR